MKRFVLGVALSALVAGPASAVQRTFVSAQNGFDSNPCSVVAPCRTFGMALTVTDSGGEVIALDSGGYGPINISQSVSITAPAGVYAGITTTVLNQAGILVNAPSGVVNLRGLTLNGLSGTGQTGIFVTNAAEVHVENAVIFGFWDEALSLQAPAGKHVVKNVIARSNQYGLFAGSNDSSNPALVAVDGSSFFANSGAGVMAGGYSKVVTRNSIANGNPTGFLAGGTAGISEIEMHDCEAAFNTQGVYAYNVGLSVINVSSSLVTENGTGVGRAGLSVVNTAGDNVVHFNTSDGSFNGTFAKQ